MVHKNRTMIAPTAIDANTIIEVTSSVFVNNFCKKKPIAPIMTILAAKDSHCNATFNAIYFFDSGTA